MTDFARKARSPNVRPWREKRLQKFHRNLFAICELAESYGISVRVPDGWHHVQFRHLDFIGNYYPSTRRFYLQCPVVMPTIDDVSPEDSLKIFLKAAVDAQTVPYEIYQSNWSFREFKKAPSEITKIGEYLLPRLRTEILQLSAFRPEAIDHITPMEFEHVVAELLRNEGYKVTVTPASGDGGKDIIAIADRDGRTYILLVECKKWLAGNVGIEIVQRIVGVRHIDKADHAMIVTTARFTGPARSEAERVATELTLVDRTRLHSWIRKYEQDIRSAP